MRAQDRNSLIKELAIVSKTLKSIEQRIRHLGLDATEPSTKKPSQASQARILFQRRRDRDTLFSEFSLFGEPAWDMLIVLFIAAEEDREINLDSLCLEIALTAPTALRWISVLEANGLIERSTDLINISNTIISISTNAKDNMELYCKSFVS